MEPFLIGGLAWLLSQTQVLSHVAERLLDRFLPGRETSRLPHVETAVPARQAPAAPGAVQVETSSRLADRLIVPPPGQLLFVRENPSPSRPVLAIVLSDGPSSGRVRWVLGRFDVPIELDLPANAIALLPLLMWLDGPNHGRIVPHDFQFTGTVDGHQIYAA